MTSFEDFLSFTVGTFTHRPTRSWLTILGVFIGIAAVVSLISIALGLQNTINEQFELLGTDKIIVTPGGGALSLVGFGGEARFVDHDVSIIDRARGVGKAIPFTTTITRTDFKSDVEFTWVSSYPPDLTTLDEMVGISVEHGRELRSSDKFSAVVGYLIGNGELYEDPVKVGSSIEIGDRSFEVVGIAERIGNRQDDTQIYIPLNTNEEIFGTTGYNFVYVIAKTGFNVTVVAEDIENRLRKDRDLDKGEEDFSVQTLEQLTGIVGTVIGTVQLVVISIAAISLIVGGVGIMNTMYSSVLERTREIGIMKAIGATNSDIMILFLLESGVLGLIGGSIGVILGVGGGMLVTSLAEHPLFGTLQAQFPLELVGGALLFSFLVGALSGMLPARKAAQMKPVEALRYE